ncbi:hypothetical protein V8F20_001922 [Naviculisporaceae sp. PSN 640]
MFFFWMPTRWLGVWFIWQRLLSCIRIPTASPATHMGDLTAFSDPGKNDDRIEEDAELTCQDRKVAGRSLSYHGLLDVGSRSGVWPRPREEHKEAAGKLYHHTRTVHLPGASYTTVTRGGERKGNKGKESEWGVLDQWTLLIS